jgi:hypothetical protein
MALHGFVFVFLLVDCLLLLLARLGRLDWFSLRPLCWLHRTSVPETSLLRSIDPVCL